MSNKIEVKGIIIHLQKFNDSDYVSLTDIVKGQDNEKTNDKPNLIIRSWLKNLSTLDFFHNTNVDYALWLMLRDWECIVCQTE